MLNIRLNVGIELRADGLPLTDVERKAGVEAIEARALSMFGGYTAVPTVGSWFDKDTGQTHSENSILFDIVTDDPTAGVKARELAAVAKRALQQASVLLRVREEDAEFV